MHNCRKKDTISLNKSWKTGFLVLLVVNSLVVRILMSAKNSSDTQLFLVLPSHLVTREVLVNRRAVLNVAVDLVEVNEIIASFVKYNHVVGRC
ncbi:hypothetical protein P5673_009863 [Acropora cervicornis]|uniref:Transmembrane protein n=1 Tax=Acropora cervicornis TaxID=6130 RepID=A0AAD9QSM1_ACRCE|nr:hypothetical protein P5673_009863 [Acropora cervicornis]